MRDHVLLLERRHKQSGVARRHEGRVAMAMSNTRWCSDGFEFRCKDGARLCVTFALDDCDREALSWVAVRTATAVMMSATSCLEAVEKRFEQQSPTSPIALDGKTLRGSCPNGGAVHLMSAFATQARRMLVQQEVPDKASEITSPAGVDEGWTSVARYSASTPSAARREGLGRTDRRGQGTTTC
ncbi:hypothetical protein FCG41_23100 [Azotobacter chroococcum]|nr:hypothetical protein FCG41_23100 [Azotobacter chroococcum]